MINTFHLHKYPMSRDCCIITQFKDAGEKEESLGTMRKNEEKINQT